MKYANKQNAPFVLIVGDNEIEKSAAILKNMKTGEQFDINIDSIINDYNKVLKMTKGN